MQDYQREFLDFALDVEVLRFGEFTLKSGRVSPYFFNAGLFNTGASLARLGRYYAQAIVDSGIEFDVLCRSLVVAVAGPKFRPSRIAFQAHKEIGVEVNFALGILVDHLFDELERLVVIADPRIHPGEPLPVERV